MAILALRIVGPNVGDFEYRINITDQNAGRILAAYGAMYGPVEENGVSRPRTPTEIVERIAKDFQEATFNRAVEYEKEVRARQAQQGVTPITPNGAVPVVNGIDPEGKVVNDAAAEVNAEQGYFTKLWSAIKGA